jgi:hypothetical protein
MNPDDLIKAAPEIAKGAGALAAAIPFTSVVKRMLGPTADELAEMWRDQVRMYRYERQLKCVEKAERMAQDAGFTPQAVPPKILFPLLEGASMEEDETLHEMWAALLANASRSSMTVRPNFISILRDMAPDEATILCAIPDLMVEVESDQDKYRGLTFEEHPDIGAEQNRIMNRFLTNLPDILGETDEARSARFDTCVQALITAGLIESYYTGYGLTGRA